VRRSLQVTLALLILSLLTGRAGAATLYTFSGDGGLAGTFSLDETTPFLITEDGAGVFAQLISPKNHIAGTFNLFTFDGTATLEIFHAVDEDIGLPDSWIVRSTITGPSVGTLTPAHLNLFVFGAGFQPSLTPPPHNGTDHDFQFTFGFTDGNFVDAPLRTLVLVPDHDPPTLPLLALALLVVGGWRVRQSRRTRVCSPGAGGAPGATDPGRASFVPPA
jgi:hypothetical protein